MKAVVWKGERDIEYVNYPEPAPKDNEVKLKVLSCGYCVTDYHIMTGKIKLCEPPHVLGHEICGEIVEAGKNANADFVGRRVVVETYVGCGKCEFCKKGMKHLCEAGEIGYPPYQGGEAEYVCVPESCCHFLPDEITDDEAGVMEAAVCPFGAIMTENVKDKTVLVYGAGIAGISFIQAAVAFGAKKVICVVRNDIKKEQALFFGANVVINEKEENMFARVMEETDGYGADIFAEATGAKSVIESAFKLVKKGGRIILYGLPDKNADIRLPVFDVILNQIGLCGYTGNSDAWEKLIEFVKDKKFNLKDMVTLKLPLSETKRAMEILDDKPQNMIKIVLKPQEKI